MSILDSIPGIVSAALSDVFRDATLTRVSVSISDGMGGHAQTTATDTCKALVTEYTAWQRQALGIPANERKILILAATLTAAPKPTDKLTIQGKTWSVVEVASDPANATYECRGR